MVETRFWLVRHAEPEASIQGRCYGKLDVALSERGREQAARLAQYFASIPLDAVYASPRRRTLETAQALSPAVIPVEALREIDFGLFEGRPYDEISREFPAIYRQWMEAPTTVEFPGGEGFAQMQTRVLALAAELRARHAGQTIALVAHGGTHRILLADALGIPPENIFRLGQPYACVSLLRFLGAYPIVEAMNVTLNV